VADDNWHREFFDGLALELWRQAVPPAATEAEVDFLVSELGLGPGSRVLDVPCGLGRHALPLAARGLVVTGFDGSPEAIASAQREASEAGLALTLERRDMRDLPVGETFEAICCLGNSFGYVDPTESARFLSAVSRALVPGGRLVLHTGMAAESVLPNFQARQEAPVGELRLIEENRFDADVGCIETRYTFLRGAEREVKTGYQWVFSLRELRAMLEAAGLCLIASYGGFDRRPFALGTPELVLVAERR